MSALDAAPAPLTGLWTAASGIILAVSLSLAVRILTFHDRARRAPDRPHERPSAGAVQENP